MGCNDGRRPILADNTGPPVRGGTLKVVSAGDLDHLAPTSAYTTLSMGVLWIFARQLVTYPLSENFETSSGIVADLAETVPTFENGGISADARTYTFHLRRSVMWNTAPPQELNAHDVVRGLKLICNPHSPSGAPAYYTTTIQGMKEHCDAFARTPATIEDIRRFLDSREIEGVRATDDFTVVFKLLQPASDFLNVLAMPFASAVPIEYLAYLPDSPEFRQHTISNGPYQIVKYTPNREIQFERNPAWNPATDPLRPAYVDRINIVLGIDQQLAQLQLEAGTADLSLDIPPTSAVAALLEIGDPKLMLSPPGEYFPGLTYLVVNMVGTNGGALSSLNVRQALEYAVSKTAVAQVRAGPRISRPARQAVASGVTGYRRGNDMYETPMDSGDPEKARELLAEAGYREGLTIKLAYRQVNAEALMAQTVQESFRLAGIEAQLTPYSVSDYYGRVMTNPENARRGVWDVALAGWYPDWQGGNNSRSVIQPLFDGRSFGPGSMDYGGYNSAEVNSLIDRALSSPRVEDAEKAWAGAASIVMKDAAIIPLIEMKLFYYRSSRVRNCLRNMWSLNCDMTAVWLGDDREF